MEIKTKPATLAAGYYTLPVRVVDTDVALYDYYNYLISLCWNESEISDMEPGFWRGQLWVKLSVGGTYKVGDKVFLADMGELDGIHEIVYINSNSEYFIDATPGASFGAIAGAYPRMYNSINWRISPDSLGEAKLDLHNTVKDFLEVKLDTQAFGPFASFNTRFTYEVFCSNEFRWKETINQPQDNGGFAQITIDNSSLATTPLKVGDKVTLSYDMVSASFSDNQFSGGDLAFPIQSGRYPFLVGQTVWVTGQTTEPKYNGETTVKSLLTNDSILVTNKAFTTNTPQESGAIYGHPRPEWNGTYQITGLVESGADLLVTLDLAWTSALPAGYTMYGTVRFAEDVVLQSWNGDSFNGVAFNANLPYYDDALMASKVFQSNQGNFASIYTPGVNYRVEPIARFWLLSHNASNVTGSTRVTYKFYNKAGTLISTSYFALSGTQADIYWPGGIEQILGSATTNTLPNIDDIFRYEVGITNNSGTYLRPPINFRVTFDCTTFDVWHLIWRDNWGSLATYPFKRQNIPSIEKEAKTYYNTNFWNNFDTTYDQYVEQSGGDKTYFSRHREKIELNTGWIDQAELPLIKDLFKANQVWLVSPNSGIFSAKIEETSIPLNTELQELIEYKFNVTYSKNTYSY
jgi:hypothetical protein